MVGVLLIERPLLVCDVTHIGEHAGDHLEYILTSVELRIPVPHLFASVPVALHSALEETGGRRNVDILTLPGGIYKIMKLDYEL